MKYLNKRGYVIVKEHFNYEVLNDIREELTVRPFNSYIDQNNVESYQVFLENEKKLYLPKIYGIEKFGEAEDRIPESENINLRFNGEVRENQKPAIDASLKQLKETGGGILVLPCGYGKTCIGLYLISQMKKKTLVICHKEFLVNQWKDRIETFLPEARLGKIQGKKFDIEDKDIVIGMLQSLSIKEYDLKAFDSFDFIIVDECHHISSKVFSRTLKKINCHYHIGLSATPVRSDGLMKVLEWHFGKIYFSVSNKDDMKEKRNVKIKRVMIENHNLYSQEILNFKKRPQIPSMITNIINNPERNNKIIEILFEVIKEKRNILVLSDRRDHLIEISKLLKEKEFEDFGFYIGGMKEKDLKLSENRQVIFGTYMMCSEGYDNKNLDTLIMATPKGNIEQSIGRVLRKDVYDIEPLVVDIVDNFSAFINQAKKRMAFYKKKGYIKK